MIVKMLAKMREAARAVVAFSSGAVLSATEFRLMSRKVRGGVEGAVIVRLSWADEALDLSERMRHSAISASIPSVAKEHKVSKQTGQA